MSEQLSHNPETEESGEMNEKEFVNEVQAAAERNNIPQESMGEILNRIAENSRGSETWPTGEQNR